MDKWQIPSRVGEIRREIAQIREENRIYTTRNFHGMPEIAQHVQRQRRLKEIMVELTVLSRRSVG